ncbi:TonB-dependent siderophore receptor [Marinobacter lacisalsi]|uniref:TonB-dependent siderophore receptor n=1 Tax=Marinobacter lacisalsi TaxID=475979 RepID=A0ABV8QCV9_9GAMM
MLPDQAGGRLRLKGIVRLTGLGMVFAGVAPVVLAQSNGDQEPVGLNALEVTGSVLKVDVPLAETPQPASVVNREELDDRNVQSLDESFRYRSGVVSGHYGADNDTDWFKVRGFDQATYQDGLRIYREGYYQWLPETFGLERVEVFKGPASILYGEAPTGGIINAVSKRPSDQASGIVEVQAGNRDHRQLNIDTTGPLTDRVSYRLVGVYKDREGDLDHTENERYYLAPSLAVELTDQTRLTLLSSLQKDDGVPVNAFKLPYGTVDDTPYGKVDTSTNLGQPGYDKNERTQVAVGYELEHALNQQWSFLQNLRYNRLDLELRSSYASYQDPGNPRNVVQGVVYREGTTDGLTVDNRLAGHFFTERTENILLVGVDYQNLSGEGEQYDDFLGFGTVDMFDPVYGNYTPVTDTQLMDSDTDKEQIGAYVQNQLRIDDRWVLMASARHDWAETEAQTGANTQKSDDSQWSLSGGVMYLADNGLSPYVSYSESFQPLLATETDGDLYEPLEGKQLEAGVKYAPTWLDGYVSAAVYELTEENSLVQEGQRTVQEGEKQSRGFELEGNAYLTDEWQLTLAYTYTDAEDKNDEVLNQLPLIPRHRAAIWTDYSLAAWVPGLSVGGGLRYNGESVGHSSSGATRIEVDAYTVADLMARYDFSRNWRAQVNVNNLTDEEYVASCDYYCYYGESRSVIGSLSYRW